MMRSWRHFYGQDKPITGIDGSMFFQLEMLNIIFHRSIRFQLAGELQRLAVFIYLS